MPPRAHRLVSQSVCFAQIGFVNEMHKVERPKRSSRSPCLDSFNRRDRELSASCKKYVWRWQWTKVMRDVFMRVCIIMLSFVPDYSFSSLLFLLVCLFSLNPSLLLFHVFIDRAFPQPPSRPSWHSTSTNTIYNQQPPTSQEIDSQYFQPKVFTNLFPIISRILHIHSPPALLNDPRSCLYVETALRFEPF